MTQTAHWKGHAEFRYRFCFAPDGWLEGGRQGRAVRDCDWHGPQTIFIFWFYAKQIFIFAKRRHINYCAAMTFYSLPFTPERVEATEARLEAIYEAAKYGLKGDSLALRAGLTPAQYRRLAEFDPLVEMAEMKGRADGEWFAARTLHTAAQQGDATAALNILKHQHGWVSKQAVEVSVDGQISVIAALEKAQQRVIDAIYTEVESAPTPSNPLITTQVGVARDYDDNYAKTPQKTTEI
jgi:hypothetical protein